MVVRTFGINIERSGERRGFYIYVGGALSQNDALGTVSQQLVVNCCFINRQEVEIW